MTEGEPNGSPSRLIGSHWTPGLASTRDGALCWLDCGIQGSLTINTRTLVQSPCTLEAGTGLPLEVGSTFDGLIS